VDRSEALFESEQLGSTFLGQAAEPVALPELVHRSKQLSCLDSSLALVRLLRFQLLQVVRLVLNCKVHLASQSNLAVQQAVEGLVRVLQSNVVLLEQLQVDLVLQSELRSFRSVLHLCKGMSQGRLLVLELQWRPPLSPGSLRMQASRNEGERLLRVFHDRHVFDELRFRPI
jgi:hypothetical protein